MFAIVNIAGQQFKVEEGQELFVHRLDAQEGERVDFDQVYLLDKGGDVQVGTPVLKAKINATILQHVKGDKVIVFRKNRRKGFKVRNGHRQYFTKIKIENIAL